MNLSRKWLLQGITIISVGLIVLRLGILAIEDSGFGPRFNLVTGEITQPAKTFWDWMGLLIVPIILAVGGYILNRTESQRADNQRKLEREIADDRLREQALQIYFDRMTDILEKLTGPRCSEAVKAAAQARTLMTLSHLGEDAVRKGALVRFLAEAGLLGPKPKLHLRNINLKHVDLTSINLAGIDLEKANLTAAKLKDANLVRVNLISAKLTDAQLRNANLLGANLARENLYRANLTSAQLFRSKLSDTDLRCADLRNASLLGAEVQGADLSDANLKGALLNGADFSNAILPDESIWNNDIDMAYFTDASHSPFWRSEAPWSPAHED